MITKFKKRGKKIKQGLFFKLFFVIFIIILICFLFISNWKINEKRTRLNKQVNELKEQIQVLQDKKKNLENKAFQSLQGSNLEKEARERFNLKKPDEEVVVVLSEEDGIKELLKEKGFWEKIWDKINFFK